MKEKNLQNWKPSSSFVAWFTLLKSFSSEEMLLQYLPDSHASILVEVDSPQKLVHLSKLQISESQKEKEKLHISFLWIQISCNQK